MLFRRRKPIGLIERIRVWLWPRRSFSRSISYMGKRLLRISATPNEVALGLAIGVWAASSPLFGLHIFIAIIFAWLLRGNIAAAVLGTVFSNPLTFLPIVMGDYKLGHIFFSLFGRVDEIPLYEIRAMFDGIGLSQLLSILFETWDSVMKPMLVGGLILGFILGGISYIIAYRATFRFQKRRQAKILEKIKLRIQNNQENI